MRESIDRESALADRLRREAAGSRPEFSQELHRRLCRAVLDAEVAQPATFPARPPRRPPRRALVAVLAAAAVLAMAVIFWQVMTGEEAPERVVTPPQPGIDTPARPPAPPTPDETPPSTGVVPEFAIMASLVDQATEELVGLVESAETAPHWAYLDQNAEAALSALNRSVPLDAVASLVFGDPSDEAFGGAEAR